MLASALVRVGAFGLPMTKACAQDDEQQALITKPGITDKVVVFIVGRLGSSSDQRIRMFCCRRQRAAGAGGASLPVLSVELAPPSRFFPQSANFWKKKASGSLHM